jgi:hypothetical protein
MPRNRHVWQSETGTNKCSNCTKCFTAMLRIQHIRSMQVRIQSFDDTKWRKKLQYIQYLCSCDQKLQFTCPQAFTKDVQATGVAFSPLKRTFITSKQEISSLFTILKVIFALQDPDPYPVNLNQWGSMRVRICNTAYWKTKFKKRSEKIYGVSPRDEQGTSTKMLQNLSHSWSEYFSLWVTTGTCFFIYKKTLTKNEEQNVDNVFVEQSAVLGYFQLPQGENRVP